MNFLVDSLTQTATSGEVATSVNITKLGVLVASIAHEVNEPLSGIIINASVCMRMLASNPPNIHGALETAQRTIRDGNRAADVITQLRTLFDKEAITEPLDLN
jgi:signal transduction histidine kinase